MCVYYIIGRDRVFFLNLSLIGWFVGGRIERVGLFGSFPLSMITKNGGTGSRESTCGCWIGPPKKNYQGDSPPRHHRKIPTTSS